MDKIEVSNENDERNDVAVAAIAADDPQIFKLRADEFHGIFDLLSLQELIAVGKTCTRLQTYAGDFYQANYILKEADFRYEPQLKVFSKFIPNIEICPDDEDVFRFVGSNCKSAKQIKFVYKTLTPAKIEHLKPIGDQIESIRMCNVIDGFSYTILKTFPNLKRLSLVGSWTSLIAGDNNWLQRYPALEHLELWLNSGAVVDEIGGFFEHNPNIRSFAIKGPFLSDNQHALLKSLIKLDDLAIHGKINGDLVALLNELHGKGFYKRLHLYSVGKSDIDLILKLNGLNKLHYCRMDIFRVQGLNTAILTGLKELVYGESSSSADMKKLAKTLVNLERLCIGRCNYNQLLPLIRHSKFLKKISIGEYIGDAIDLKVWNEERKNLIGNELVTGKLLVYMREGAYLKCKWANKDTSLEFIELRRRESFQWGHHFAYFEENH